MQNHFTQKCASLVLIVGFVMPFVFGVLFTNPRSTHAAVPTAVVIDPIQAIANGILASLEIKEFALDAIAWALVKYVIQQISHSLISWINSGFRGDPLYLGNMEFFFYDVCAETLDSFMGDFAVQPIPSIAKSIIMRGVAQTNPCAAILGESAEFILPTLAESIINTMYSDLRRATWQTFTQFTNSRNNFYGQQRMAEYELARREAIKSSVRNEQLDWGSGFLQFEKCTQIDDPSYSAVMGTTFEYCQNLTPGAVVEDHLAEVLGDDVRTLELADEIDEILAALIQQLISQVFGGVMGLFGVNAPGGYNFTPTRLPPPSMPGGSRPGEVTLRASPTEVSSGQSVILSWSTASSFGAATSCRASGGEWDGELPGTGSRTVMPTLPSQEFGIDCIFPETSTTYTASVTVTVR